MIQIEHDVTPGLKSLIVQIMNNSLRKYRLLNLIPMCFEIAQAFVLSFRPTLIPRKFIYVSILLRKKTTITLHIYLQTTQNITLLLSYLYHFPLCDKQKQSASCSISDKTRSILHSATSIPIFRKFIKLPHEISEFVMKSQLLPSIKPNRIYFHEN